MTPSATPSRPSPAEGLIEHVLTPMKSTFVGKDEIIDLLGLCLVGGENLFLMGAPGTAKSALVHELSQRVDGRAFDYLLTRFTEPNELFGPFDIRKLREGELITNTEGMLPEAEIVFLDELLNANSAVLNSLLMVLNERVFRRGRESRRVPMLMAVGASNHLPEDDALQALFDRFLVRIPCHNVAQEQLGEVLRAGWDLDRRESNGRQATVTTDDIRRLQREVLSVDVSRVRGAYVDLIHRLRHAGIAVSDRRAVRFQRLMAASALLTGRDGVEPSDMWVLRHTWNNEEQQEVLATLVDEAIKRHAAESPGPAHPRAHGDSAPDPETLARDLDRIASRLGEASLTAADRSCLRDQLSVLSGRHEWVAGEEQRRFLKQRIDELWPQVQGE